MPRCLACFVVAALLACAFEPDPPKGDAGPSADGGPAPDPAFFDVETRVLDEVAPLSGRGLSVAARSDGRWAVAFVGPGAGSFTCELFGGGETANGYCGAFDLAVATESGEGFSVEIVATG